MTKRIEKITLGGDVASSTEWRRRIAASGKFGFLLVLAFCALTSGIASLR